MAQGILLLFGLSAICGLSYGKVSSLNGEERLLRDILDSYGPALRLTRPVKNPADIIRVEFGLSLLKINKLDEETGDAQFVFWDKFAWNDTRLTWDPAQYDNIDHIRIPPKYIWTPDLVTYNSFHKEEELREDVLTVVNKDGYVLYIPPHIRHGSCSISDSNNEINQAKNFECNFKVGSWTYSGLLLDLNFYGNEAKMDLSSYVPNKNVEITDNTAKRNVKVYDCCPESYIDLNFKLILKN